MYGHLIGVCVFSSQTFGCVCVRYGASFTRSVLYFTICWISWAIAHMCMHIHIPIQCARARSLSVILHKYRCTIEIDQTTDTSASTNFNLITVLVHVRESGIHCHFKCINWPLAF